jgi:hypothetical protein
MLVVLFDVHIITLLTSPLHIVSFDIASLDPAPLEVMVLDTRRIVGSKVHAKALHVTNNGACSRRHGARKTTKQLQGTGVEAEEVLRRCRKQAMVGCHGLLPHASTWEAAT